MFSISRIKEEGQKEKYSCFQKCGWQEKFSFGLPEIFFFSNLTEIFLKKLHLKNYSNSSFPYWKTKNPTFYCSKRKKQRQFVRINLQKENRLNGESYWPNVFNSGFKIRSLTWTLHGRSQNLQPVAHLKNMNGEFGF